MSRDPKTLSARKRKHTGGTTTTNDRVTTANIQRITTAGVVRDTTRQ